MSEVELGTNQQLDGGDLAAPNPAPFEDGVNPDANFGVRKETRTEARSEGSAERVVLAFCPAELLPFASAM